jgi:septal ring factor EnvC (AmiA/AmiB activator)
MIDLLRARAGLLCLCAVLALARSAAAQDAVRPPAELEAARRAAEKAEERTRRESELKAIQDTLARNVEARRALEAEVASLKADRARLNTALLETTNQVRVAEERTAAVEQRLQTLTASEEAIRRSLEARRGLVAEVLAALQRMGRRPPPAVLVRPEDMLLAIRTSMLLGAVLPELRTETEVLASDLAELVRLRTGILADREALQRERLALATEQERLKSLVAARQERLATVETSAGGERERVAELGLQARSLQELVDRLGREASAAQKEAEETRRAAEAPIRETRERFAAAAFRDPARLAPRVPFAETRGLLPRPVSGAVLREFGAADEFGAPSRGIALAARPGAVVSSPADGWVAFAGPFRSFGRLLIINTGGGYYVLLAGMDQVSVEVGQFVLAGEPVGTMGSSSATTRTVGGVETSEPVLYVEFRKDGGSIDPAPWWAKSQGEKVRG